MNAPDDDMPEFGDLPAIHLAQDDIPETLKAVLKHVASNFLPELVAQCLALDVWLEANPDIEAGERLQSERRTRRPRGRVAFTLNGVAFETALRPTMIQKLQRVTDRLKALVGPDRAAVMSLLEEVGLVHLADLSTLRRVERRANRDVWGDTPH